MVLYVLVQTMRVLPIYLVVLQHHDPTVITIPAVVAGVARTPGFIGQGLIMVHPQPLTLPPCKSWARAWLKMTN